MPVTETNPVPTGDIVVVGDRVEWTRLLPRRSEQAGTIIDIEPGESGRLVVKADAGAIVRIHSNRVRLPGCWWTCDHIAVKGITSANQNQRATAGRHGQDAATGRRGSDQAPPDRRRAAATAASVPKAKRPDGRAEAEAA